MDGSLGQSWIQGDVGYSTVLFFAMTEQVPESGEGCPFRAWERVILLIFPSHHQEEVLYKKTPLHLVFLDENPGDHTVSLMSLEQWLPMLAVIAPAS